MRKLIPLISLGLLIALGSWFMSQNNKMSEKFFIKLFHQKNGSNRKKMVLFKKG